VTNPLRTPDDYELFIYTIQERFPSVHGSTLTFVRRGASLARVAGELYFSHGLRLAVLQRIVYDRLPAVIEAYAYEIWRGEEKLFWYDSQPHPGDPVLESTHPHHKHIPPEPRHNRVPAPGMSFDQPNLPGLIAELEQFIRELGAKPERR
jgi:hypothetical protein